MVAIVEAADDMTFAKALLANASQGSFTTETCKLVHGSLPVSSCCCLRKRPNVFAKRPATESSQTVYDARYGGRSHTDEDAPDGACADNRVVMTWTSRS